MPKILEKEQDYWHLTFIVIYFLLVVLLTYYLKSIGQFPVSISIFDFAIVVMAVFRLIRLFSYDSVTDFIRTYLAKFDRGPRKTLSDLLDCPWCTGVWMSLVVAFFYFVIPYSRLFFLLLAIAGVGTFIQITVWKIGKE